MPNDCHDEGGRFCSGESQAKNSTFKIQAKNAKVNQAAAVTLNQARKRTGLNMGHVVKGPVSGGSGGSYKFRRSR